MATANPRGVQVSDVPSSLKVVVQANSASIVAIGTAPVHSLPGFTWTTPGSGLSPYASVVNKPILCIISSDFTTQLGLSSVFGPGVTGSVNTTGNYTLSEVYDLEFVQNNASPFVAINVFDPWSMSTVVTQNGKAVSSTKTVAISGEVILASLSVVGVTSTHVGVQGTDFTYTYNDASLQTGVITLLSTGNLYTDATVNVSFYTPNLAAITQSSIIGGTDVNGNYFGISVLEKVFTVTGIVPATVITPGWGANTGVIAAANSHVQSINNGRFRAIYIADIDTTVATQYTQVTAQKSTQNLQTAFELAGWPHVGLAGKRYHASTMLAVMMQNTDAAFGGLPYVSPSNKVPSMDSTILRSGAQVVVDPAQADFLEQQGIFTFINFQGWKSLGDYTCAYPTDTNIQDFWINERRMFNFLGNTLSLTLAQFIDLPGNLATLASINETIQSYLNTLVQKGAANTARVSFNPNENLVAQVAAGIYTFHILWTPPTPIRTLNLLLQFDVQGLTAWISQINLVSTQ
jgi:phage tail sheath protein FI